MKPLILGKLNLHDLARIAPTCKYFQTACVNRAIEERAALIATAVEAYGEDVFSGFVTAVQRALRGLSPCPGLDCEQNIGKGEDSINILIGGPGGPRNASGEEV